MMASSTVPEVAMEKVQEILDRMSAAGFSEEDRKVMETLVESYSCVTELVQSKDMSIQRLRALIFGSKTEKTKQVLAKNGHETVRPEPDDKKRKKKKKAKGHGKNGASEYTGAKRVDCPHGTLESGAECPECKKGKVYPIQRPGLVIRVTGQAPLAATVYELEKLRCNLCGELFTANAPKGIGDAKYDARSAAMIALLKYGTGLPFYRLAGLQKNLGIPLPASTQWEIVRDLGARIWVVFQELIRQAAQGDVVYNDDTNMTILDYVGKRREQGEELEDPTRTGVYTSGIVATHEGKTMALYFTGRKHAGENLQKVLLQRSKDRGPPIQMCDPLSRNTSPEFEAIVAKCLLHGRRKFVEVSHNFPDETQHILETLGTVYKHEAETKKAGMSPEQRQRYHWKKSRPLMDALRLWMQKRLKNNEKGEPNDGLGKAMTYMEKHWKEMTLFLRLKGAPLDNNLCERSLKRAILHRKNALFYRTQNGAHVGDLFMSFIHTCQLSDENPFDYLTAIQVHLDEVEQDPGSWMPWNYLRAREAAVASGTWKKS